MVQNYVFFQNIPVDTGEAGVTTLPSVFCSDSKHGENLKTVSFSLLFPQNVPLEMMNANLTTLPISFEVAIKFYIMCENDKKKWLSPKGSFFQHCSTGHVKAVWPSCQLFFAQIQKQVTFVKVFKKLFFSTSFSGRVKIFFDRFAETTFAKSNIRLSLKVRNWKEKSAFSIKHLSFQFVLLDTRMSVLQKLPKAFRDKSYKILAQSPRIKTKNWWFS